MGEAWARRIFSESNSRSPNGMPTLAADIPPRPHQPHGPVPRAHGRHVARGRTLIVVDKTVSRLLSERTRDRVTPLTRYRARRALGEAAQRPERRLGHQFEPAIATAPRRAPPAHP